MARWGLESVGLAGSEYRCEERGVKRRRVSARVSASIQKMDSGWGSGSAWYRRSLQMNAIANHYLISRGGREGEEPKGMCNQKGRRTLDDARMPTAPSLAWAVPGVVI